MKRPSREDILMDVAKVFSRRGTCPRGVVGVVIEKEGRIISTGYVSSAPGDPHCEDVGCLVITPEEGCTRTIHAELAAICFAAKNGVSVNGATMITTLAPCLNCSKAIFNSGIRKLTYLENYRDSRGIEFLRRRGVEVSQIYGYE